VAGAWVGADYLAPGWVADGYLPKSAYVVGAGAWVNQGYISRKYVSPEWLYSYSAGAAAAVTVGNVPAILLAVLPGSARQTTKVNATSATVPLATFAATANAGTIVAQTNAPGIALAPFATSVDGTIHQIADVTFTIEVESQFGYEKLVSQQAVAACALNAIDAIVTVGANVNVAATQVSVPLVALSTSVKANSSTRAVSSVPTPLQVFAADVSVGKTVDVIGVPIAIALAAIPVSVAGSSNQPTSVTATLAELPLDMPNGSVQSGRPTVIRGRSFQKPRDNRRLVATAASRKFKA
jgi:hypothetical protein